MPTRISKRLLLLLLGGYLLLLLLPAGAMPLMESTEARYAEIAREMVVTGNYLEPYYHGIKHFHKPPLTYWAVAAGFKLFGMNDFGARVFGVLTAALAVFFLYRLARLFFEEQKPALIAATAFGSSLMFLTVSRLASTEIYLTCFTIAAQYYLFRQLYGRRHWCNALLYGLFLGLGFFTKGPIILLFTLLPALLAKLWDPEHRHIFSWRETVLAAVAFVLVALPWYLLVAAENPGLLHYFLKVQTVDRVVTDRFHRYQPPWYFLYIFPATFFPFSLFLFRGLGSWRRLAPRIKTALVYIAAPLLVFSLAKGKHATYILPFYGIAALLTAAAVQQLAMPRIRILALLALAPIAPALAAAGWFYPPLAGAKPWLLLVGLVAAGLLIAAWRRRKNFAYWGWLAGFLLFFSSVGIWGVGIAAPQMRGYEQMANAMNQLDPNRELELLVYDNFLPSLSFYRDKLAVSGPGLVRETQFQPEASFRPWYPADEAALKSFLEGQERLFVVVDSGTIGAFSGEFSYRCEPVFIQRKKSAYLCRRATMATTTSD